MALKLGGAIEDDPDRKGELDDNQSDAMDCVYYEGDVVVEWVEVHHNYSLMDYRCVMK